MLQKRSFKSFEPNSKKFNRRARITLDSVKINFKRFLPLIILIPSVIALNAIFTIKKINCTLNENACPKEVQTVTNQLLGTNSLFVNQKELLSLAKAAYPVDEMSVGYPSPGTANVSFKGSSPFFPADIFLVGELPRLSMDQAPSSTDSAGWWVKPTGELQNFVSANTGLGFNLWESGSMTSIATTGATINYIFSEKPTPETITSVYRMIKLIQKYLDVSKIYIVNNRCFLSRAGEPDIIIGVPFDEGRLAPALQSLGYLSTIKKDTKVIDLSFTNPIIR